MKLNYKVFGEGEPLIILHGLLGSLDNWLTVAKKIAENNFQVFIIDQRNHGKSPHTNEHSFALMVDDLLEFMNEHNIDKAHLLGHSMGGKTVMQFTNEHIERVKSQIIVDIAPKAYTGNHDAIFEALFALNLSVIQSRKEADNELSKVITDYSIRQFLLKNIDRVGEHYKWKPNIDVLFNQYDEIRVSIKPKEQLVVPTLVISGENSGYVNKEDEAVFSAYYKPTYFKKIKGAGHWIHAETPLIFVETVLTFLNKV